MRIKQFVVASAIALLAANAANKAEKAENSLGQTFPSG